MISILYLIIIGVGFNLLLLGLHLILSKQIGKYEVVEEQIIKIAKRARTSYILIYIIDLLLIASIFYVPGAAYKLILGFSALAIIIILEIMHNSKRLVLTERQLTYIEGYFAYTAIMVEYKDIEIVVVKDSPLDKILGYGNLEIRTVGEMEYSFHKIPKFLEVKNIIEKKKI